MTPAVANLALAKGTAYDVALVIQDAAAQPIDLAGFTLEASIRAASDAAPVDLAVIVTDAAAGLATVRIPAQPLGMGAWELWMQAAPETPRERALRGLVTVSETVDPREKENPSSHRLIVRVSDTVTVIVDAVDLAWWAYTRAVKAQLETASLASTWPQTVSNAEQTISAARDEAVSAVQSKQSDAVLAVGRASQTAQQSVASAQSAAVAAVETAETEAVQAVKTAQATAESSIGGMVQEATDASTTAQKAKGEAESAAGRASISATSAANSATEAQQALEAIPQVDASGNMTLAGGLTAAGAINANGGINIPLAVGAVTDTSAVNRLYAAGMAGVTGILTSNAFLNTDAITASGSSTVTKTVPYHLAGIKVPKGTHSTIQARFEVSNPQWNYSSFAGFSFLWRATNAAKLSFGIGRGGKTIRPDLSIDSYSIIPANGLAYNHGEILDITFDNVRNKDRNGYTVRVREIFALNNTDSWQVKTTTSFVPASQNEPVPWTIAKIIYQQKSVASIARYEDTGALWLILTGGQGNNLYQIATCRGVSNFETGVGVSQWVTDVVNNAAGDVSVYAGTGEYTYYHPGNVNPVFYGLDAISRNCIETEETADFVDINIPL